MPYTIDWPRSSEIIKPCVRIGPHGMWWLHYRVLDSKWSVTPGMPTDFSIVLEAQNEDDALTEAAHRLMISEACIRRFGA